MKIKRKTPIGDGNKRVPVFGVLPLADKKKDPDRGRKPM